MLFIGTGPQLQGGGTAVSLDPGLLVLSLANRLQLEMWNCAKFRGGECRRQVCELPVVWDLLQESSPLSWHEEHRHLLTCIPC